MNVPKILYQLYVNQQTLEQLSNNYTYTLTSTHMRESYHSGEGIWRLHPENDTSRTKSLQMASHNQNFLPLPSLCNYWQKRSWQQWIKISCDRKAIYFNSGFWITSNMVHDTYINLSWYEWGPVAWGIQVTWWLSEWTQWESVVTWNTKWHNLSSMVKGFSIKTKLNITAKVCIMHRN